MLNLRGQRKLTIKNNERLNKLQEDLGYYFNDLSLLERALTHSSFAKEQKLSSYNERLEFLGDAYLDAIIGRCLYDHENEFDEGSLSKIRSRIVCEDSLLIIADKLLLSNYLYLSKGEKVSGGSKKKSILADAMEAIIGAVFLDGGYDATEKLVMNHFSEIIDKALEGNLFVDYKTLAQEKLQVKGKTTIIKYVVDRDEGPAHDKVFYIHLECDGEVLGHGVGKTKKEAERNAAKATLEMEK